MKEMKNDKVIYKYTFNLEKAKNHIDEQLLQIAQKNNYDGMIYVGSTNNAKKRHYQHKVDKGYDKFHNVTKQFDLDLCFDYDVLWLDNHANIETIREVEQGFIDSLQPFDENGFNTCKTTVLSDKDINKILNKSVLIGMFDPNEKFKLLKIFKQKSDITENGLPYVDILPKNIRGSKSCILMPLKLLHEFYELDFEFNVGNMYDELSNVICFLEDSNKKMYCVYKYNILVDICGSLEQIENKFELATNDLNTMLNYNEMVNNYNVVELGEPKPLIIGVSALTDKHKSIINGQIQYR